MATGTFAHPLGAQVRSNELCLDTFAPAVSRILKLFPLRNRDVWPQKVERSAALANTCVCPEPLVRLAHIRVSSAGRHLRRDPDAMRRSMVGKTVTQRDIL